MSEAIVINLSEEEKKKLITFLKDREVSYGKRTTTLEREYALIKECTETVPKGVNKTFMDMLQARQAEWAAKLFLAKDLILKFATLTVAIENNETIDGTKETDTLKDFYFKERESNKKIEKKFEYYPRLRKAKEASLYELANKIKKIMESKYVKIA